jgi:hypothetical protein
MCGSTTQGRSDEPRLRTGQPAPPRLEHLPGVRDFLYGTEDQEVLRQPVPAESEVSARQIGIRLWGAGQINCPHDSRPPGQGIGSRMKPMTVGAVRSCPAKCTSTASPSLKTSLAQGG